MDIYLIRNQMKLLHISIFDLPLRVTYYARVSTKSDAQLNSIENQISHFEELIRKNTKWIFVDGYVDEIRGESAANRDNFMRMVTDAKLGKFDFILTKEISRFARDLLDSISYTRELLSYGVCVLFESDGINTIDQDSELRLGIMATIAQEEVRKLSERIKFGHKRAIEGNAVLGNGRIFGYDYKDRRLTINESEAEMVKKLFELYATDQYSLKELEKIFWNLGYKGRTGKMISHNTFSGIIKNPKYKGFYCGGKVKIEDYRTKKQRFLPEEEWRMFKDETGDIVPQIVDEDIWERANIILARRSSVVKSRQTSMKKTNALTGMIFCTVDGKPYWRSCYTPKSGREYYWVCSERRRSGTKACPSATIYERELYAIISQALLSKLKDIPQAVDEYISFYMQCDQKKNTDADIKRLKSQIEKTEDRKNRLLDMSLDGTISRAEFTKRNDQFNEELGGLEKQLRTMEQDSAMSDTLFEMREIKHFLQSHMDLLTDKDFVLTDEVIKKLISRIEVTPKAGKVMELNIILKSHQETRAMYQHHVKNSDVSSPGIVRLAQCGPSQPILQSGNTSKKMIEAYENSMK